MTSVRATHVDLPDDDAINNGEAELTFRWPDPTYGTEGLTIDWDGYCSRCMPIRSGQGPPDFIELARDHVKLRFSPELARQLQLDEEIDIAFDISDAEHLQLCKAIEYFRP